jgi:hypothetical protein
MQAPYHSARHSHVLEFVTRYKNSPDELEMLAMKQRTPKTFLQQVPPLRAHF